jgi:hypothetical protein
MSFSTWIAPVPSYENEEHLVSDLATLFRLCCGSKPPEYANHIIEEIENQYHLDLRALARGEPDEWRGGFDEFVDTLARDIANLCFNHFRDVELTTIHDKWVIITGADDNNVVYPESTKELAILAVLDDVRALSEPKVAPSVLSEENIRAYIEHYRLETAVEAFVERMAAKAAAEKALEGR